MLLIKHHIFKAKISPLIAVLLLTIGVLFVNGKLAAENRDVLANENPRKPVFGHKVNVVLGSKATDLIKSMIWKTAVDKDSPLTVGLLFFGEGQYEGFSAFVDSIWIEEKQDDEKWTPLIDLKIHRLRQEVLMIEVADERAKRIVTAMEKLGYPYESSSTEFLRIRIENFQQK